MSVDILSIDLDGTLVDTAPQIARAVNATLAALGIEPREQAEVTRLIGNGAQELMLRVLARAFLERPVLADAVRVEAVLDSLELRLAEAASADPAPAYAGVADALDRLRAGGVKLACVTNKESLQAHRVLDAARLLARFDLVVGGDTLAQKKPHRDVLRHVVGTLGGDARRAAHVGDSHLDVEAARNAGVAAWAVPYGYNAGRPIADAKPDRIFGALAEVADHVLAGRHAAGGAAAFSTTRPIGLST